MSISVRKLSINNQITNGYEFSTMRVEMPEHDADIVLVFPNGKEVHVQSRPSNADLNYDGSLDFILPYDMAVQCCQGDDLEPAPTLEDRHIHLTKQIIAEIPMDNPNPS